MTTPARQPQCNIKPTAQNHCGNCQNTECDWYNQREIMSRINQHGEDHFSMRLATEMSGCRCHTSAPAPDTKYYFDEGYRKGAKAAREQVLEKIADVIDEISRQQLEYGMVSDPISNNTKEMLESLRQPEPQQ